MNKIYILAFVSILYLSGCYKYPQIDYDYQNYNRVVGAAGGDVTFYSNYSNDSLFFLNGVDSSSKLLELEVPAGALDSDIVFNFYQYQNINTATELSKGLSMVGSKFFYFVPIYASDGYHEHDNADLTYHLSLKFKKPITVKYYFKSKKILKNIDEKKLKYEFYDRENKNYRLYRLKIPGIDEWGDRNIFVQWNRQGYPIGYNSTDLNDIILGLWYPFSDADEYNSNLTNWEEVDNFTFNDDNSISFKIQSTDYIYVIAQVTNIPTDKLPLKIVNYLQNNYGVSIERAAFVDQEFQIVLENNYIIYFQRNGDFDYAEKYNLSSTDIPSTIYSYINSNYLGQNIKTSLVRIYPSSPNFDLEYSITLTNSVALLFSGDSSSVAYEGKIIYDYDQNSLSSEIKNVISSNYSGATINNVILHDIAADQYYTVFVKYKDKNIKLYFDFSGELLYTVYYGLKEDEIPADVKNYLNNKFPNVDLVSINNVTSSDSNYYDIELLNDAYLELSETAKLYYADYFVQSQNLPVPVTDTLSAKFSSTKIVEAYYHFDDQDEYYWISFQERLNVASSPDGTVLYAEGRRFKDLPIKSQNYIIQNYSIASFSDFYYLQDTSTHVLRYTYHITLKNGTILLFDINGNFIQLGKAILKKSKYIRKNTKPITFD